MIKKIETKVNQIKQNIKFELGNNTKEKKDFLNLIKEFFKSNGEIEGDIINISFFMFTTGDLEIGINTIKEDRIKLLKDNSINV